MSTAIKPASRDNGCIQQLSTKNSSMVALTNKLEEQLAAQNIRHNQAIAKMLEKITALQSGGGGGGTRIGGGGCRAWLPKGDW